MSGNIFDNMRDESKSDDAGSKDGAFTIQFGTEMVDVAWKRGMTLRDAFLQKADFLGIDSDRVLSYRDSRNNLLDGSESPEAGVTYSASITHDEKGC